MCAAEQAGSRTRTGTTSSQSANGYIDVLAETYQPHQPSRMLCWLLTKESCNHRLLLPRLSAAHARLQPHRLLPAKVADWTVPDVQEWLEAIGMAQYADVFEMTGIDGAVLSNGLNDTTLDMLMVSDQIHRQQLRNALRTQLSTTSV
jgi:hypothetical protein